MTNKLMEEALWKIRTAGNNEDPTSQWMQKWAAWGLEPEKWDRPEENPPSSIHIISAAIKIFISEDNLSSLMISLPPPHRHHEIRHLITKMDIPFKKLVQGFLTSKGEFVTRERAAEIAIEARQALSLIAPPKLYTEDLW